MALPVSISLKTKAMTKAMTGTGKYTPSSGKSSQSWSKSRCAQGGLGYSISLKVKWGYILAWKLETEREIVLPVSISQKNQSSARLQSLGRENIPEVPANLAKVGQNYRRCA